MPAAKRRSGTCCSLTSTNTENSQAAAWHHTTQYHPEEKTVQIFPLYLFHFSSLGLSLSLPLSLLQWEPTHMAQAGGIESLFSSSVIHHSPLASSAPLETGTSVCLKGVCMGEGCCDDSGGFLSFKPGNRADFRDNSMRVRDEQTLPRAGTWTSSTACTFITLH